MSFAAYIYSSILLSLVGAAAYAAFLLFRPGIAARRFMLWAVILCSLLLPLRSLLPEELHSAHETEMHTAPVLGLAGIGPTGGRSLYDFCHCTAPEAGDVIRYHASKPYDLLLHWGGYADLVLLILALFWIARGGLRTWYARRELQRYETKELSFGGKLLRIVRHTGPLMAGSVRLGGWHVLWNPKMDALEASDREAVLWHEYAHLKQGDTAQRIILDLLRAIWWMNPVFRYFRREADRLSEYLADDYAVARTGNAKAYALLLLRLKSGHSQWPVHGVEGGPVGARIARILRRPRRRMPLLPTLVLGILILGGGDYYAQTVIHRQITEINVYEYMSRRNQSVGTDTFCKKCTYEAVGEVCTP